MAFEISTTAYRAIDAYVAATKRRQLRGGNRRSCWAHPEWTPLTAEELSRIDRRDRDGYMIYKNMGGGGPLEYYLTNAPYKTKLLPALNPLDHRASGQNDDSDFADKNYHEVFMPGITFPKTVLRRIGGRFYDGALKPVAPGEALERLSPYDELVFKASVESGHGHGIRLAAREEYGDVYLNHGTDYVVQERVRQHDSLAYFNPSSVNVVRVTTLSWRDHVYVLGGILRVGSPGAFCDHENRDGHTYLTLPMGEDGTVLPRALDVDYFHCYDDCRGKPIRGVVPGYTEMCRLAKEGHDRFPRYGLIGWDFTVDAAGNVLCMEFNTKYPGLIGTQCALGPVLAQKSADGVPLFDELMELIR